MGEEGEGSGGKGGGKWGKRGREVGGKGGKGYPAVHPLINQHKRLADIQRLLLQEWPAIPQRQIQRLVNSMRRRLNECRVNLGGYTYYREETVILSFLAPNPIWLQQKITHASMMKFLF